MNIFENIKQQTHNRLDHTAVIEGNDRISYGQLIRASEVVAESLRQKGVTRFQRVALVCDDSIDYIITSLAILSIPAVVVPISADHTLDEIEAIVERMDVDFVITEKKLRRGGFSDLLPSEGLIKKEFNIAKRTIRERPKSEYFRINPAFIRFSSGTTGASKGVVLSHEAILERTDAADQGLQITQNDRVLWVLSMSFHFVVTILLFLRRGATIILCGHKFPESLLEGIREHHGTMLYASPFHYSLLARAESIHKDALSALRMAISTAMKLPDQIAEDFTSKFGMELTEAYGIIEVGLPFVRLAGGSEKRGSVGKPLPGFQIALDNKDQEGVGEIRIKGKGMLDAYYAPWQSRDDILVDGWFKTGDLGKIDKDGFLFIVGRNKDVINFAGMKVFPQEVEAVLNEHPDVKESLVYGVSHPQLGQLPYAKIVLQNSATNDNMTDALRRFCYQRLAQYKVPKDFEFVEFLPKTMSGKIKR